MQFCTCVTYATLPHARVLADALARHHRGAVLHALALGRGLRAGHREPFALVAPEELEDEDAVRLERSHAVQDVDVLLRPALIAHVRARAADDVCFLSADHDVLAALPSPAAEPEHPVVLVPRVGEGLPDDTHAPDAWDLRVQGPYSPDLLIVGRSIRADEFLAWHAERMRVLRPMLARTEPALSRQEARRRARLVLALAPARLGVRPLSDPGLEASFWNLHARVLGRNGGGWLADGRPLRTVHFAGFDPWRPYWLSEHGSRVRVVEDPALGELCADYARRLLERASGRRDRRRD
ncbi:MAG: hypothetical protein M3296_03905, partial [Actinomycetota bacterium]|nr:hypothetical protein [Actinomycetota bacterium]